MSYINKRLGLMSEDGEPIKYTSRIDNFLKSEGFKWKSYHDPRFEQVLFKDTSNYNCWVSVYDDLIYIYVEFRHGEGRAAEDRIEYEKNDFDSLFEAYEEAIDFVEIYIS